MRVHNKFMSIKLTYVLKYCILIYNIKISYVESPVFGKRSQWRFPLEAHTSFGCFTNFISQNNMSMSKCINFCSTFGRKSDVQALQLILQSNKQKHTHEYEPNKPPKWFVTWACFKTLSVNWTWTCSSSREVSLKLQKRLMRAEEANQTVKLRAGEPNQCCMTMFGASDLWVHHYKWPFSL